MKRRRQPVLALNRVHGGIDGTSYTTTDGRYLVTRDPRHPSTWLVFDNDAGADSPAIALNGQYNHPTLHAVRHRLFDHIHQQRAEALQATRDHATP